MKVIELNINYTKNIYELERNSFPLEDQMSYEEIKKVFTISTYKYYGQIDENYNLLSAILIEVFSNTIHILSICISEKFRCHGYANDLLNYVIELAKVNDIKHIYVECRESNFASLKLLTKFKFEIFDQSKNYYSNPDEDALLFKLDL